MERPIDPAPPVTILDPMNETLNIGRTAFCFNKVQSAFHEALENLRHGIALQAQGGDDGDSPDDFRLLGRVIASLRDGRLGGRGADAR